MKKWYISFGDDMKLVTNFMVNSYKIMELGYDFCGYTVKKENDVNFHHLVIARRDCDRLRVPNEGYYVENGAILHKENMHPYLHTIERIDGEIFSLITSEMIDENVKGRLDIENIRRIRDLLLCFEREHCGERTKKGHPLIKESYIKNRIKI